MVPVAVADEDGGGIGCAGDDAEAEGVESAMAEARGSFFRVAEGEGVSTNMIDGPAVSSGATAVRGVGLEVNFGNDWCLIGGGRTGTACVSGEVTCALDELSPILLVVMSAVSEVVASGCGFNGVTESAVGRSSCEGVFQRAFL